MLADNRSSLNEELLPFVPVARVYLIRILFLLVNVSFMSDVEDGIDHLGSLIGLSELLCLLIFLPHEVIPLLKGLDFSGHLLLHGVEHLLLLEDSILSVKVLSLVVLGFSQLPVLNNDSPALSCSPGFVSKLFLLFGLSLHSLEDLCLSPFLHSSYLFQMEF